MVRRLILALSTAALACGASTPYEAGPAVPAGKIDELVFARLRGLGIRPANLCSDEVFLRRAYLDATGTLPTEQEASDFLEDASPGKRAALVDRLLARDEFADYQAMKWSDLLRVKSEFPINLWPNATQAYYRWIRTAIRDNMPYDRFAWALLTSSGSNFRVPEVNFYRALPGREPRAIAQAVALTFMGARAGTWPEARLDGMAGFFSRIRYKPTGEWKEEIVLFDPGADARPPAASYPDGKPAKIAPGEDPRQAFATWLLAPGNPWFARNLVNRVWYWLLGRGIIHEPDDIRPDNPASNPELLAYLEREFVAGRYDLKRMYRLIMNSAPYQLSSVPAAKSPAAAAQFAYYPLRKMDAETLIDAICQITGSTESYSSPIPEPFTFLPEGQRAIALPDGSIGSAFLEMFGRPPRDSGLASERNGKPSAEQRLHMLNSSHIQQKIQQSTKLRALLQGVRRPRDPIDRIYLTVLSRRATDAEAATAVAYVQRTPSNRWAAVTDVIWALINSAEFQYRH